MCSRPAQQVATLLLSRQPRLPAGKPRPFTACWHKAPATELSNESPYSKLAGGRPAEVDERIGMTALNAGRMLQELRTSKLAERTDK